MRGLADPLRGATPPAPPKIDTSGGYGPTYWEPVDHTDGTTELVEHQHPWWLVHCMRHDHSDQVELQEQAEVSAENPNWFCATCALEWERYTGSAPAGTYMGLEAVHENALQRQQEEREREAERRR